MATSVYTYNHGEHVLRKLMDEVNATMTIYHVWGSHLGSPNLFRQHEESRRRITETIENLQVIRRPGSHWYERSKSTSLSIVSHT